MSRPSATSPGGRANARWRPSRADRTGCQAATLDAASPVASARNSRVTSSPASRTSSPPVVVHAERGVEASGHRRVAFDVVGREAGAHSGERHQPVQGTAVQQVPAEVTGHLAGDRALAGPARAVDRNDRNLAHPSSASRRPAARAVDAKPGNDVATFCTSRIVTCRIGTGTEHGEGHGDPMVALAVDGAAADPSTADAQTVRATARRRHRVPQSRGHGSQPVAFLDPKLGRSGHDRLTVRQCGHRRTGAAVRPWRSAPVPAALRSRATVPGAPRCRPGVPSSAPSSACTRMSAPMSRRMSSRAVRVGLMPTSRMTSDVRPGDDAGADEDMRPMKNRRECGCPSRAASPGPGSKRRPASRSTGTPKAPSIRSVWSRETPGSCTRVRPLA